MDIESIQRSTTKFFELIQNPREDDPAWQDAVDAEFLGAGFGFNPEHPFGHGPDGHAYFFSTPPVTGDPFVPVVQEMDQVIHWVGGWAVLNPDGTPIRVYSPGDFVALKLFGRSRFRWAGGWDQDPDPEEYRRGGEMWEGRPSLDMFPALAARSLEFILRRLYPKIEVAADQAPAIKLVRLATHSKPEDASDLALNVTFEDLGGKSASAQQYFNTFSAYLPRHLAKRIITQVGGSASCTPLRAIVEEAGLTVAPDRPQAAP